VLDVDHITNKSEARDLAEFILRQSRSADSYSFTADATAIILEPNDIVFVTDPTFKINSPKTSEDRSKYWRVVSTKINVNNTVDVACTRYEPEDFAYLSKLLEERKYKPLTSPIAPPIFQYDAVEKFPETSQAAGWGRLHWESNPVNARANYTYKVAVSRQEQWKVGPQYNIGEVVYWEGTHYKSTQLHDANDETFAPTDPIVGSQYWELVNSRTEAQYWEVISYGTPSLNCIIPHEVESRYFHYAVSAITPMGSSAPAYLSVDIDAVVFGLEVLKKQKG